MNKNDRKLIIEGVEIKMSWVEKMGKLTIGGWGGGVEGDYSGLESNTRKVITKTF